ncbi:MAG: alpha/beta hydrolase [Hyphomicrobiales bacterium]|nr:MAG: alpha/beta hydrolase [Hyphomicrobiales bacterium]
MTDILWTRPEGPSHGTFVFAHGAGVGMDSPFMAAIPENLLALGITTARFEFAYMAGRRTGGSKRPPPRADKLIPEYEAAIAEVLAGCDGPVVIGGKSMGGRVAAMVAGLEGLDARVCGVACLGYPFHAPGKPDAVRLDPLLGARLPVLIAQGERDPFGKREEVEALPLPASVSVMWLDDGDHDLAPRGRAAATRTGNLQRTAEAISAFFARVSGS